MVKSFRFTSDKNREQITQDVILPSYPPHFTFINIYLIIKHLKCSIKDIMFNIFHKCRHKRKVYIAIRSGWEINSTFS